MDYSIDKVDTKMKELHINEDNRKGLKMVKEEKDSTDRIEYSKQ